MIYINAPIGVGKTSLAKILSMDLGVKAFLEDVSKIPYLSEFYADGSKSRDDKAFTLQIAFVNYRFSQLKEGLYLMEHDPKQRNVIYDSSLMSDRLMAGNLHDRGEFPDRQFELYQELNQNMVTDVAAHPFSGIPDLVIYLDAPFDLMLKQINARGRDMETTDKSLADYYRSVWEKYRSWYASYYESPVVRIDMSKYDFVHNPDSQAAVLTMIEEKLRQLSLLSDDDAAKLISNRHFIKVGDYRE